MGLVRRVVGAAIGCGALLVILVVAGFAGYDLRFAWLPLVGQALDVRSALRPADVIIVLGGGDGDRDVYASQLYHRGLAAHVIATGSPIGSESGARDLVRRGVPRAAIVLANGTRNTHEDAMLSHRLMQEHAWRTALLVTDPYHIRRSLWTFRTEVAGTSVQIWPAPVIGGSFDAMHWWRTEEGFVNVNDEYLKIVYYLARGYIRPSVILHGS